MTSNPIFPLGLEPRRNLKFFIASVCQNLCNDILEADQHHDDDLEVSLGAGSFVHAVPPEIHRQECIKRNRPVANIIQSSRTLPIIPGESAGDKKRRAEFHDKAQDKVAICFGFAQDVAVLGPTIQQQMLLNPPRNLAELIQRLITSYGAADVGVINGIESEIRLPLTRARAGTPTPLPRRTRSSHQGPHHSPKKNSPY